MNNQEPILPQLQGKTLMIPAIPSSQESFHDKPKLYLRDILSKSWLETDVQQIFDQVAEHLFTQSSKATYSVPGGLKPKCAYRGENNCVCAIGSLIPDCEYNPDMESNSVSSLVSKFYKKTETVDDQLVRFLQDLQGTHDAYLIPSWKPRLKEIAVRYAIPKLTVLDDWDFDHEQQRYIKKEKTNIS